mgnify:CR=1 FL=1
MVDLGVPPDNVFSVDLSSSDSPASAAALKVALQVDIPQRSVCMACCVPERSQARCLLGSITRTEQCI